MPGNERGDRIHNFFGQENLSQRQHLPQVVNEAWTGVGNNFWHGSQRQITSAISNVKNHNVPQTADSEECHGSSSLHQGLNFSQPIPRNEFSRNRTQVQQPTLNDHVQGHRMFLNRQNQANLLGMDTEPDGRNLTTRGCSLHESEPQLGNGLELHTKSSGFTTYTESPVNYDFFGGQQQVGTQQPGLLQSLQRQQSGISEMQLLQQHQFMLRQMQDVQRQQQFQKQQEIKQQPGVGHSSSSSASINGIPVQDVSNYSWQPDLASANANWLQRNVSSATQGSSSGRIFSPGQGDMPPLVGTVPAQVDQSLYGAPVSGGVLQNRFPMLQMDKPNSQQISGGNSSFSGNPYAAFSEHVSFQDENTILRQGHQGKNLDASPASQVLSSGFDMEHLQGVNSQQSHGFLQEFHERQDLGGTLQSSQEKAISQISPPQNVATLDPTEERILFGSDDNLWDSFGKDVGIASGGFSILDGADMSGPSPSLLSGSWSALMQSAVAETSTDNMGNNMGTREEWSGLTSMPSEPTTKDRRNQISSNGDKQQLTWADNGFQTPPLNSGLSPFSGNAYANRNYSTTSGVQQGGLEAYENSGTVQMGASQRQIQQFPGEGTKWMQAEPGLDFGKVFHSNSRTNVKAGSGSWLSQQNHPFYNTTSSQHPNRSNDLNFDDSAAPTAHGLQNEANENISETSQNIEQRSPILNLMGRSGTAWKVGSVSGLGTEMEHSKYSAGSPQISRGSSDLNNNASMPDSRMSATSRDGSQKLGDNDNIDVWKHVSSSMATKWTGFPENFQPDMGKNNQTLELSRNNSLSTGTLDRHDIESLHGNEKTEKSVGSRENDASDSSCLPGVEQKSSTSQSGRKPSLGRKFQYHPMGDVDVDVQPNHGTKRATISQAMMQQVSQQLKTNNRGYPSQSKSSRHTAWHSLETEKLQSGLSGLAREARGLDGTHREDLLSGNRPSISAHLDGAVHSPAPHGSTPLSQNVPQRFHKMEQSEEQGNARQISSNSDIFSSEVPESSAAEVALPLQHDQSSAQRGFGLQLGLSSQTLLSHEHPVSSQMYSEAANHLRETHAASSRGARGHMMLAASSVQSLPHNVSGSFSNNAQQNVATSFLPGFPYSRSQHDNQHIADISRQVADTQAFNMSYNRPSSDFKQMEIWRAQPNQSTMTSVPDLIRSAQQESSEMSHPGSHSRLSAPKFSVSEAAMTADYCRMSAMPKEGVHPTDVSVTWSSLSAGQQHLSGQLSDSYSDVYMPDVKTMKNSETTSSHSHNEEDQTQKDGVIQSDSNTLGTQLQSIAKEQPGKGDDWTQRLQGNHLASVATIASQGQELAVGCSGDASISGTPIFQRENEAFGQSLKPSFSFPQSCSSIQQVHGLRNADVDPFNRTTKKFKGVDGILNAQSVACQGGQELHVHDKMVREGLSDEKLVSSGESLTLKFSSRLTDGQIANAPSADTNPLGQDDCPNLAGGSNKTSVRSQHSQISLQMAPSWFDRYGTLKNGQMPATYGAQKLATRTSDLPVPFGSPTGIYHTQSPVERENNLAANANFCAAVHENPNSTENISSSQLLQPEVASQALELKRPKKRKTATSDLVPWHREVTSGPQRLQTISSAEVDWSKAVNRLAEKVEEADTVDDIPPLHPLKRRLVLTTQLMQLLLHPPRARALFDDAILNYETVIYLVARSTLGYACGMLSCYGDSMRTPATAVEWVHDGPKTSKKIKDQYFRKVVEDLVDRSRKLEADLLRLDKRMSVLDLRVECQDLERFAVINRFAKFHGRGQADGAENSSSSDAPTSFRKYFPQRYVTALPMPKNLPDRVQCLSL